MSESSSPVRATTVAGDGLVRALGLWQSLAMVVGTLIGTGIFLVPREMVLAVHSFGWILLAWIVGGLLSLAGALAYAELGTLRPAAGGEYVFLRDGLGPLVGFWFGWGMFWVVRPASIASIGAGFALAAGFIWPGLNRPLFGPIAGLQILAAVLIALVTLINYFGVRYGGWLQTLFTALKLVLVALLAVAALAWGRGDWTHLHQSLGGTVGIGGFGTALVAALWAYDGWNDLTLAGSEVREPGRTIPLAMILGVGIVFVFYAGINLAYFYVLRPAEIAASDNVAATMVAHLIGASGGALVSVAVMVSAFATLNSSVLSGARVPFAMARDGLFFRRLAHIHPRFRTPDAALLAQAVLALLLALTGSFQTLYTLAVFAEWLFYMLAVAALFVLRGRGERGPYRSWGYPLLPALFLGAAAVLLALTYWQNLGYSSLGLAAILAGTPVYFYYARRRGGSVPPD